MIFPDTVPWEGIIRYNMGYPTKYTTPFRPVILSILILKLYILLILILFITYFIIKAIFV